MFEVQLSQDLVADDLESSEKELLDRLCDTQKQRELVKVRLTARRKSRINLSCFD